MKYRNQFPEGPLKYITNPFLFLIAWTVLFIFACVVVGIVEIPKELWRWFCDDIWWDIRVEIADMRHHFMYLKERSKQ